MEIGRRYRITEVSSASNFYTYRRSLVGQEVTLVYYDENAPWCNGKPLIRLLFDKKPACDMMSFDVVWAANMQRHKGEGFLVQMVGPILEPVESPEQLAVLAEYDELDQAD